MFLTNTCRIDAKLTRRLDVATFNIEQLETNQAICPLEASEGFAAAQAAWVEHKTTCQFCCGQQLGLVH